MSYHIYTTDGIVLKQTPFGEANILLHILTSDLGLITASARSARLSVSKLRPALQEYAYISVTCIKGKNGWKITNSASKGSFFFDYPKYTHKVMSQIVAVLMQMITGEEHNKNIFDTVKSGFEALKSVPEKDISNFETIAVLRILNELGYVVKNETTNKFLSDWQDWGEIVLQQISINKINIVGLINKALK